MNAKVSTKAIRLTILVIVILTPVCLPSSTLQSYRINIVESTMAMAEKTGYIAPPCDSAMRTGVPCEN